jgi:hypothetical protein
LTGSQASDFEAVVDATGIPGEPSSPDPQPANSDPVNITKADRQHLTMNNRMARGSCAPTSRKCDVGVAIRFISFSTVGVEIGLELCSQRSFSWIFVGPM